MVFSFRFITLVFILLLLTLNKCHGKLLPGNHKEQTSVINNDNIAESLDNNLVHMGKSIGRESFVRKERSDPLDRHELVFAVKQRNLKKLEEILIEISTPGNSNYQKWLTFDQVGNMTSNPTSAKAILIWLNNIGAVITWQSAHQDYIKAVHNIADWEKHLNAQFYQWEDLSKNYKRKQFYVHRSLEYSIPYHLKDHIFTVFNTVQTPPKLSKKYRMRDDLPFKSHLRINDKPRDDKSIASTDGKVTVSFLSQYYRINSNIGSSVISQSVFETDEMNFSPNDLLLFQQTYGLTQQAAQVPYGHSTDSCTTSTCSEGNLDIQYIMGVAQATVSIYWYTSSSTGSTDPFVAWITDIANEASPPTSNSVSWGAIEQTVDASVMTAFNNEALKVASMGVTIVVSSGDDGTASTDGTTCQCNIYSGSSANSAKWTGSNTWSGYGYFPSFPATSPYVTAVGATMGPEVGTEEIVCQSQLGGVITSGGGFSTYFKQPSWQTDAVNYYFSTLTTAPAAGYNALGRAYPDISLIGVNYQVYIQGVIYQIYGTSASAPVFAAFVSLVNAARYDNGLTSIGFINPSLYLIGMNTTNAKNNGEQYNETFNDVTSGINNCCSSGSSTSAQCCSNGGFTAGVGWDPATGWGSVNYDSFAAIFSISATYYPDEPSGGDKKKSQAMRIIEIVVVIIAIIVIVSVVTYFFKCIGKFLYACCCDSPAPKRRPNQRRPPRTMTTSEPRVEIYTSPVYLQDANESLNAPLHSNRNRK
eukprot:gene8124-11002_t